MSGSLVQSDGTNTNNLQHSDVYSGNTNASGLITVNHNCGFTPNTVDLTSYDTPSFDSNFITNLSSMNATTLTVVISVGGVTVGAGHNDTFFATFHG